MAGPLGIDKLRRDLVFQMFAVAVGWLWLAYVAFAPVDDPSDGLATGLAAAAAMSPQSPERRSSR